LTIPMNDGGYKLNILTMCMQSSKTSNVEIVFAVSILQTRRRVNGS